jgi:hypothetical protein
MRCPHCDKIAKTKGGLKRHLRGGLSFGGHELSEPEADRIVADVAPGKEVTRPTPSPPRRIVTPPLPDGAAEAYLRDIFTALLRNKALPKYQFERRIDIFLNVFLAEIISTLLGGEMEIVAPEFPLKRAGDNLSRNADYLLFDDAPDAKRWILFELKTDSGSIGAEQLRRYRSAMERGMPALVGDLLVIRNASKGRNRKKYDELHERITQYEPDYPLELVYLAPVSLERELSGAAEHSFTFEQITRLEMKRHPEVWKLFCSQILSELTE